MAGLTVACSCANSDPGVPDEKLGGLVFKQEGPREVKLDRVTRDPGELVAAAQLSYPRVSELIGAHRYRSTVSLVVTEADAPVDKLDIETTIELSESGAYRALTNNSREYGREVVFVDGLLYLAPRFSKFHRRAPETDAEPEHIRADIYGDLGAHLALVARGIEVEDRGVVTHEGRRARNIGILVAASMKPVTAKQRLDHRQWRDTIEVVEASGELAVDLENGVVLRGHVHGGVTFQREGRSFQMNFDVEHQFTDIGSDIEITAPPPDRWVSTPLRSHEVDMRDQLLEGIAPRTRKLDPGRSQPSRKSTAGDARPVGDGNQ